MAGAKPDTWMPFFWGDYLRDTGHLSTAEHGAYILLIGHYWTTGKPIPDSDAVLARITRQGIANWRKMREVIAAFFSHTDDVWRHHRVDAELDRAMRFIEKQQGNGARGGRPRKNPNETQTFPKPNPDGNPNHNPTESTSPSPSHNYSFRDTSTDPPSAPAPEGARSGSGLTSPEEWRKRLAKWIEDGTWSKFWGLRPDSSGVNPLIPPDLLQWAKAQKAQQRQGAAA